MNLKKSVRVRTFRFETDGSGAAFGHCAPEISGFKAESGRFAAEIGHFAGLEIRGKSKTVGIDENPTMRQMSRICALLGFEIDGFCGSNPAVLRSNPGSIRQSAETFQLTRTYV